MPKRLLGKFLLGLVGAVVIAVGISLFTATQATTYLRRLKPPRLFLCRD